MIRWSPLPDDIETRLPALAQALAADERVDFAYLFGSLARGKRTPTSDVDVAVMLLPGVDPSEALLDLVTAANLSLGTDEVDLVLLNSAPLMFAYRILLARKVLVERDPARRAAWESRTLREAWDFLPRERVMLEGRTWRGR